MNSRCRATTRSDNVHMRNLDSHPRGRVHDKLTQPRLTSAWSGPRQADTIHSTSTHSVRLGPASIDTRRLCLDSRARARGRTAAAMLNTSTENVLTQVRKITESLRARKPYLVVRWALWFLLRRHLLDLRVRCWSRRTLQLLCSRKRFFRSDACARGSRGYLLDSNGCATWRQA